MQSIFASEFILIGLTFFPSQVEESSLVLETADVDGGSRFFLIPNDVARKGRFKKRGTKLHVYLDHIFVARHVKG